MKELKNLIVCLLGMVVSITTSVFVMIYGWGLEPKSWFWIIGVYIIGNITGMGLIQLAKTK